MKRVFLLIVLPALLVAMGLAQTPAAGGNTDQINIKGCLGGSEGNYNIAEDNTGKISRITSSSADLKAYQGQEVILIGHKAGTADNGLAVTEVKMVSEHCAATAAAPAAALGGPHLLRRVSRRMSAYAVTRAYHFSAAHRLASDAFSDEENARVYGQCFRQHGHNYVLEVTVSGALDPATGMSVDIGIVDAEHLTRLAELASVATARFLPRD